MKILMTGSTGFTGKCLVKMLEDSGYEIYHLVRSIKGFKNEFVWDFMGPLPAQLPPCDVVIHLAAHVNFGQHLEIIQYNINTVSTIRLSAYSKKHNAYFIFASMTGVHGSGYSLIDENTPVNPDNHYGLSKYLSEEVIQTFLQKYSILRICGIYGLNGPSHLGLNRSISDAVHKKKVPVLKGPGKAKRNYICVHDVARWILNLVQDYGSFGTSGKSFINDIIYMASTEILSIKAYLELIAETLLGGMGIKMVDGLQSRDLVVKASKAPFALLTFRAYLRMLRL